MERKIVKIMVDMYSDTKFKIIDTMEDRDLIHYIWTRLLTLAGKVNLEGELYLSKNIAYTIETLALEFNRSAKKVALALKVFMDLEMVELTKNNIYKVMNFSKHQNIKKKKKDINKDKLEAVENEKVFVDKCDSENKDISIKVDVFKPNDDFIIRNEEVNSKLDSDAEVYSNNKFESIERIVNKENETDKLYEDNSNKDFIITNKYKPNKGDMSKREIGKNKDLNNNINSVINVEKIKKDSNFNVVEFNGVDFNINNKIKNDDNCINQNNNNIKDNKLKDKIEIENKNILDKVSLNKSEDINNAEVLKNKVFIVNKEHESYKNNKFHELINKENKNDVVDLKDNNVKNYITEDKKNNKKFAFSDDKKTVNKDILDNEFTFNKAKCKKKKNTSKSKKKKNDVDEIICDYESEDYIEICEFKDDIPKGNVIATFEV